MLAENSVAALNNATVLQEASGVDRIHSPLNLLDLSEVTVM